MATTPILQFGTSRFLQAHADLFISEALSEGRALGRVTVVQSSGDASRRRRLEALAAPEGYPVRIEGLEAGVPVKRELRSQSITRALTTEHDWPEVVRIATGEAEIILSNTGDSGWAEQPDDAEPAFRQGMSYPAKLAQLLLERFTHGGRPLQVMPTELVARNGDVLRARVLDLATNLGEDFAEWVRERVVFVNSLVDRIVSEPLQPAGAVAEPYALWAVEECPRLVLPCRHPAIQVMDSLDRIERQKLHILNLGHTYLVAGWLTRGAEQSRLVRDELEDPAIRADLKDLYRREVLPVFAAAGCGDATSAYVAVTLDRFANPFLAHRLADIAENHREKVRRRIVALLDWAAEIGVVLEQPRLRSVAARAEPRRSP